MYCDREVHVVLRSDHFIAILDARDSELSKCGALTLIKEYRYLDTEPLSEILN